MLPGHRAVPAGLAPLLGGMGRHWLGRWSVNNPIGSKLSTNIAKVCGGDTNDNLRDFTVVASSTGPLALMDVN